MSSSLTPPADETSTLSGFSFFPLRKIATEGTIASMVDKIDKKIASSTSTPLQKAQFKLYRSFLNSDIGTGEVLLIGRFPLDGKTYFFLSAALQVDCLPKKKYTYID
jgi:hypothetical protein